MPKKPTIHVQMDKKKEFSVTIKPVIQNCVCKKKGGTMLYNTVEIAAIKLALQNMEHQEQKCKTVLLGSIRWLRETYERTRDEVFLKKAVWHIYAYLEMGFLYEYGKEEFTYVLSYLHTSADEMNPPWKNHYKKIRASKMQICKLLGSWNPKLHCMKIGDAVNDIIEKINSGKVGEYTYHCGKQIQEERGEGLWEHTFRLYVREDENVFYDVRNNLYYELETPAKS